MKKQKIINKKGISLVVAMALSIFLMMITGTFLSLSIFQQNETGAELNTRQAYISAKSALDLAKDMVDSGDLPLPENDGQSQYYVLFKDGNDIKYVQYDSAEGALNFINSNRDTVIGDSYIKITNDGGGNYTMTAYSAVGTYTVNGENYGDLTIHFTIDEEPTTPEPTTPQPTTPQPIISVPEINPVFTSSSSNRFLMVGSQTNFSLLKSATGKDYQTLKQEHKSSDTPSKVVYEPYLNTNECPVNSHFPIVYTNVVKIDSNSYRCVQQAYDDGIYFLGNYTGNETSDYRNPSVANVSYFTNNNSYGTELHCKFITISRNMTSRTMSGQKSLVVKEYGSDNYKYNGQYGVVVYLPNGSTFSRYDDSGNQTYSKSYASGYYWLPTGANNEGTDLLSNTNGMQKIEVTSDPYKNIANINMYNSLVDASGNVNDMHSAYESEAADGKTKVSILSSNGKFTTSSDSNSYSTYPRTTYTEGYQNYSIYCGPSATPTKAGYYDMYCGKDFNYLWYNKDDMVVKSGVKMFIRSSDNVLTIGPDTAEGVYKHTESWGWEWRSANEGDSAYDPDAVYTASNVVSAADSSSEFWLCPYWNQSTYKITIMNDFVVNYNGGSYTVHKGVYGVNNSSGINLFSDSGKNFFTSYVPSTISSDMNWVNSTGEINNVKPNVLSGTANFVATSGSLSSVGPYTAQYINCDFSGFATPLKTNNANMQTEYIEINAPNGLMGFNLNIVPSKLSRATIKTTGQPDRYVDGLTIKITENMTIVRLDGTHFNIQSGLYLLKANDTSTSINIMDKTTWDNAYRNGDVID